MRTHERLGPGQSSITVARRAGMALAALTAFGGLALGCEIEAPGPAAGQTGSSTGNGGGAPTSSGSQSPDPARATQVRCDLLTRPWAPAEGPDEASIVAAAATTGALYVGTAYGLFRSTDAGASFSPVADPRLGRAFVTALAADGAGVYAAAGASFLHSADGESWEPMDAGLPQTPTQHISFLFASADDRIALKDSVAYRFSEAAGKWQPLAPGAPGAAAGVDVAASGGGALMLDTVTTGVVRSTDGSTWLAPKGLSSLWGYHAFWLAPGDAYAASDAGLFRSEDAGQTWSTLPASPAVLGIAHSLLATEGAVIGLTTHGIVRSTDHGQTWVLTPLPQAVPSSIPSSMGLARSGAGLFAAADRIYRSTDGGAHWSTVAELRAADVVSLGAAPHALFASTADGRVHRSADGGLTWADLHNPYAGKQSSALRHVLTSAGVTFGAWVDPSTALGGLARSIDDGATWKHVASPDAALAAGLSGLELLGGALVLATAGTTQSAGAGVGLYRSTDSGGIWESANGGLPSIGVDALGAPLYPRALLLRAAAGRLFVSLEGEGLYRSDDAGSTWHSVQGAAPVLDATVMAEVHGRLIAASALGRNELVSDDAGATWAPLDPAGLPEGASFRALVVAGGDLVATIAGGPGVAHAYRSRDGGASWTPLDEGLDLEAGPLAVHAGRLWAGTHGRSLYALPLGVCTSP